MCERVCVWCVWVCECACVRVCVYSCHAAYKSYSLCYTVTCDLSGSTINLHITNGTIFGNKLLNISRDFWCFVHRFHLNVSPSKNNSASCYQRTHTHIALHVQYRSLLSDFNRSSGFSLQHTDTTPTQPHRNSNTHRTKKNTTDVVIQQNSRKLLMMDTLMSETCWAHKKWNKIASDIKVVSYCSIITTMHGPIYIRTRNTPICWYPLHLCVYTACGLLRSNVKQ